ncbi:MAG: hypothetical protein JWP81_3350 [Ferruginibacter sp.]|nr:hypothetical protein [Ferruginibacter sp.]
MNERLLQYIWQFQYFNRTELSTTDGEPLLIISPGNINRNQGPDFLDGKIKLANTTWAGSIELHILSSDWNNHKHSLDKNYGNVILHVVWQDDIHLNLPFPVFELRTLVSKILLARFDELMNAKSFIACEKLIGKTAPIIWIAWKERLLVERMQKKTAIILEYLTKNNNHWEETFWWLIARNFGITVNSDAFEKMACSLPLAVLAKHKNQLHQAEALLFGQAGLLENDFLEDYPQMLQREYRFYRKKYQLQPIQIPLHFLRMRPSNFPTVRLSQLAMLIHNSIHLFSIVKETIYLKDVKKRLNVTANDYWSYHYTFDEATAFKEKNLGTQMINSIMINTVIPVLFAYGHHNGENAYKEKALSWLEQIVEEKNSITKGFDLLGVENKNAFDSQSLIQLKNEYCNKKRCLECAVGNKILKPQVTQTS